MDFSTVATTFGIIFLAELGDKTQLTAMALALRFPWKRILWGIALAFALLNLLAVLVGKILFSIVPLFWVKLLSGLLFIVFGVGALRGGADEDDHFRGRLAATAFRTAFLMIFFAEMGDKTQVVTASLAAQTSHMFQVFIGSTLALTGVALIGIFLGKRLLERIPLPLVHRAAGVLFFIFGGVIIWQAFSSAG